MIAAFILAMGLPAPTDGIATGTAVLLNNPHYHHPANPKDTHIINKDNHHLFVTLHPDGTYTCNEERSPAEAKDDMRSETEVGTLLALYAMCGDRVP